MLSEYTLYNRTYISYIYNLYKGFHIPRFTVPTTYTRSNMNAAHIVHTQISFVRRMSEYGKKILSLCYEYAVMILILVFVKCNNE